eukprot:9235605-Pyramimonas_sp.AAC.1
MSTATTGVRGRGALRGLMGEGPRGGLVWHWCACQPRLISKELNLGGGAVERLALTRETAEAERAGRQRAALAKKACSVALQAAQAASGKPSA